MTISEIKIRKTFDEGNLKANVTDYTLRKLSKQGKIASIRAGASGNGKILINLIGAGVDPTTVSGILGHSQVSTTMNLYSHMFKENQVKACDAVANSISLTKKNESS